MRKSRLKLGFELDLSDYKALTWYSDTTKLIRELYGDHWQLFADLLAATSPRAQVKKNWRIADELLKAYTNREHKPAVFGDLLASSQIMASHLPNIIRALQRRPVSGPKVSRFAENIKGNLDVVTVDVWVCKAYGIEPRALTKMLYARLEKHIQKTAKQLDVLPANYQAVIWQGIRRMSGLRTKSFVSVYRSIFCETPYFAFMSE